MGPPTRKGWRKGSSLTFVIHLACDVTVGRRVSIHFRRGVQHKLGQDEPCLRAFARFLGLAIF